MRRLLFVFLIIMMTTGIGFAQPSVDIQGPHHTLGIGSNAQAGASAGASATGGAGGNATIYNSVDPTNTFNPTNINTVGSGIGNFSPSAKATIERGAVDIDNTNKQKQSQSQGQGQYQGQGQGQGQNNDQVIAPHQEINISAPSQVAVGSAPNVAGGSELNFVSPNERDVQTILPKFGCGVVLPLQNSDCIVDVVWQSNDVKFKDLYKEVLRGLRSDAVTKLTAKTVRYQIREAASSKTWTTGGSIAGNGVGQIGTTIAGASGGLVPQVGRSKSSNLYTIIFVQVQQFKN